MKIRGQKPQQNALPLSGVVPGTVVKRVPTQNNSFYIVAKVGNGMMSREGYSRSPQYSFNKALVHL